MIGVRAEKARGFIRLMLEKNFIEIENKIRYKEFWLGKEVG